MLISLPSIPAPAAGVVASAALALALGLAGNAARAQALQPPPSNVVTLSASASVEVVNDWLTIVFSTSRDGADAATVQAQLKQALDTALAEARKAARPGQLEVQTGGFSLYPRYAAPNPRATGPSAVGGIVGWQGSTELLVQGRDAEAIGRLSGRISTLTIARTGFSLSREARDKVEAEITAQAIQRFRSRADAVTREFGMAAYTLREVSVSGDEPPAPRMVAMRAQASMAAEAALPVEAGKSLVTSSVSGSVQMAK
ncbi:MAG: SIMPL domain-containing protein [Chitinophagaceae bacterium]|nr:SIMPL domain-containing protein [Rubrivivax sp.]